VIGKLCSLLGETDEVLLGNVSLCLSLCAEEPAVLEALTKDTMKKLLVLVREANNNTVKQNCAILIGKMAKGHPK